ncbi:MAG TPA: inositol monophosphatase family protein [Candidatus Limosilactobacillus merdipullorum]|uniref:Inositol monophosphatase family protein n=1 Tax=Candidatus Limosilactobacillus merdipullorum TaxID=2838653 RepID=A0A9D1QP64_9LACO|nr:inositol monophosphatase family protein [Candidatus Limosilactobacillus merdipullorum]
MTELKTIDSQVRDLIWAVREKTAGEVHQTFEVDEKTSYKDLVTTVDKRNERWINRRLKEIDPGCRIVSEEGFGDQVNDMSGHVWVVDPLDGTMNFVMQRSRYAIMIGLFVDGQPSQGYIMDVTAKKLYHGGPNTGVFVQTSEGERPLHAPADKDLHDSLVSVNSMMILHGDHNLRQVALQARGLRMYGSAGLEITDVLAGRLGAYISWLKPWDAAAGRIMAAALNLTFVKIDGTPADVLSSNSVLIATNNAAKDILRLVK